MRKKCTCRKVGEVVLAGQTFAVVLVCPSHTLQQQMTVDEWDRALCSGPAPRNLGRVDFELSAIYLAGCASSEALPNVFYHEVGHIVAWFQGIPSNDEAAANLIGPIVANLVVDCVDWEMVETRTDIWRRLQKTNVSRVAEAKGQEED